MFSLQALLCHFIGWLIFFCPVFLFASDGMENLGVPTYSIEFISQSTLFFNCFYLKKISMMKP